MVSEPSSGGSDAESVLMVRAQAFYCALPIAEVNETCRPLPIQPVEGLPSFVRGVAVVRGVTTPVLHLGALLAGGAPEPGRRFVVAHVRGRPVALEVDEVLGVRQLSPSQLSTTAPLVGGALSERIVGHGVLDGELWAWLEMGRLVSDHLVDLILAEGWA